LYNGSAVLVDSNNWFGNGCAKFSKSDDAADFDLCCHCVLVFTAKTPPLFQGGAVGRWIVIAL